MEKASISETKNRLSHFLRLVKNGQTVIIIERGKAVAKLEKMGPGAFEGDQLDRMQAVGIIKKRARKPAWNKLLSPPEKLTSAADALGALLDERNSGR